MIEQDKNNRESLIRIGDKFRQKGFTGIELLRALYAYMSNSDVVPEWDGRHINSLHTTLSIEEIELLTKNYKEVFEIFYSTEDYYTFDIESNDLASCVATLLNIRDKSRILLPNGGLNFAIHNTNHKYDIVARTSFTKSNVKIAQETFNLDTRVLDTGVDSIIEDANNHDLYDHIIAFPSWVADYSEDLPHNFLQLLKALKENGTMLLFLKETVCTDPNWVEFRQYILSQRSYSLNVITIPVPRSSPFGLDGGCLILIKKCREYYADWSYLADFSKGKYHRSSKRTLYMMLDAFKNKDPQYFTKLYPLEIKENFNINPKDYPIRDEYRLTELTDTLLHKYKLDDSRALICSLAAHYPDVKPEDILTLNPPKINVGEDITKENLDFLIKHLEKIIQQYCFNYREYNSSLLQICSLLLDRANKSGHHVLLPYGQLRLASYLDNKYEIQVQEVDSKEYAFSSIIKSITKKNASINLSDKTSGFNPDHISEDFDVILAYCDKWKHKVNRFIDSTIANLTQDLAYGGVMSLILPNESCYNEEWLPLREFLVNNCKDFNTTVISFKEFHALYVIKKRHGWEDWDKFNKVKLIDANKSEFRSFDRKFEDILINVEALINAIDCNSADSVLLISTSKLDAGYNFIASRYFRLNYIPEYDSTRQQLVPLRDLIQLIPQYSSINTNKACRVIDEFQLSQDYLSCKVEYNLLPTTPNPTPNLTNANGGYFVISRGKILVGKVEDTEECTVAIYGQMIHFEVDTTKTSLDYILKIVSSNEYVLKQAECLTKGFSWEENDKYRDSILDILVILPSLEEQQEELLLDSRKGYTAKVLEIERAFNDFKEDMHLKKHAIGQTIFSINNWMTLLKLARKRGEGVVKDSDVIGKNHPHSVLDIYENLEATMKRLQIQISKMDTGYEMVPVQIGVTRFINDFISKHPRSEFEYVNLIDWRAEKDLPAVNFDESNNFTSISATDFVLRKGDDIYEIYFPAEALELILENIISNACSHGFTETEKAYKIRISGEINGNHLTIYVSNNGAPIHKDFTANDVFKYAKSTSDAISGHHGTGGYEVWKLMKQFGGSAEFISTPEEEYTVTYKLTFQISNIIGTL